MSLVLSVQLEFSWTIREDLHQASLNNLPAFESKSNVPVKPLEFWSFENFGGERYPLVKNIVVKSNRLIHSRRI